MLRISFKSRQMRLPKAWVKIGILCWATILGNALGAKTGDSTIAISKECEHLMSGTPAEQRQAMRRLRDAGKEATGPLLEYLLKEGGEGFGRERVAAVLGELLDKSENRSVSILDGLAKLSRRSPRREKELALRGMVHFKGSEKAAAAIQRVALESPQEVIRAKALGAFLVVTEKDKKGIPFLRQFLLDKSEYVKVWAAGYLGVLGSSEGSKFIEAVLRRPPKDKRTRSLQMRAAIAAGRIGSPNLIQVLKKISRDPTAYGSASHEAQVAIYEIELRQRKTAQEKIDFLKPLTGDIVHFRWAVRNLVEIDSLDKIKALEWAAKQRDFPGCFEAQRALATLQGKGIE